ncbi:MAG TPA: hypothetical protein VKQ36_17235 [Ktedonobacterales bacterium]|nr:hypothetical protein [Ktedonobacterales bacterium]
MGEMSYPVGKMSQIAQQIQSQADQYASEAQGRCQAMLATVAGLPGPMQGRLSELITILQQKTHNVVQFEQSIGQTLSKASSQAATTEAENTQGFSPRT